MQLCCCLISKFVDTLKRYPSLHCSGRPLAAHHRTMYTNRLSPMNNGDVRNVSLWLTRLVRRRQHVRRASDRCLEINLTSSIAVLYCAGQSLDTGAMSADTAAPVPRTSATSITTRPTSARSARAPGIPGSSSN